MNELSDEELMLRYKTGDMAAFDLLFEKYRAPVFNFIYRMLNKERYSAEDLLQEIFMKVDMSKSSYIITAKFSTWLFSIARNHCLNFLKSKQYGQSANTVTLDNELPAKQDEPDIGGNMEFQDIVEQIICALPVKYREVFLLHAVEGFTHQEIAEMLRAKPATVRTDYHRAKLIIKEKLELKPGKENNQ
jgi:RNA polymerase sigma-70 factor, ECF subfamily